MSTLYAQNGWTANDRSLIASYTVPGTDLRVALRAGDCSVVLLDWLGWWHAHVEDLHHAPADLWSFTVKTITGGGAHAPLSNHSAGMAVDARATAHPQGVPAAKTFTAVQLEAIRARVGAYNAAAGTTAFRWGGDYVSAKPDGMHGEIIGSAAAVAKLAAAIRAGAIPGGVHLAGGAGPHLPAPRPPAPSALPSRRFERLPVLRNGSEGGWVTLLEDCLREADLYTGKRDGLFGDHVEAGLRQLQARNHLGVDGVAGGWSWAACLAVPGTLRPGARGSAAIEVVQNALGLRGGSLTRAMDAVTVGLLEQAQRGHGLPPDGVIGPDTRAALATA